MIDTFLRPPALPGEYLADGIRILIVLSVVVAGWGWGAVQVAIFMLALLGALAPQALGVRSAVDVATGLIVLVAAWSNVFDLYTEVFGWDKLIHFLLAGLLASLATITAQRGGLLPAGPGHRGGLVMVTVAFGVAAGALWEGLEWAGYTLAIAPIYVGYSDTIGDLAADAAGALAAGLALPFLAANGAAPPGASAPSSAHLVETAHGHSDPSGSDELMRRRR